MERNNQFNLFFNNGNFEEFIQESLNIIGNFNNYFYNHSEQILRGNTIENFVNTHINNILSDILQEEYYDNYEANLLLDEDNYYRGLSKKKINSFKTINLISDEICPICLDKYNGPTVLRLPCNKEHFFHKKCILEWFKKSRKCPICRFELEK